MIFQGLFAAIVSFSFFSHSSYATSSQLISQLENSVAALSSHPNRHDELLKLRKRYEPAVGRALSNLEDSGADDDIQRNTILEFLTVYSHLLRHCNAYRESYALALKVYQMKGDPTLAAFLGMMQDRLDLTDENLGMGILFLSEAIESTSSHLTEYDRDLMKERRDNYILRLKLLKANAETSYLDQIYRGLSKRYQELRGQTASPEEKLDSPYSRNSSEGRPNRIAPQDPAAHDDSDQGSLGKSSRKRPCERPPTPEPKRLCRERLQSIHLSQLNREFVTPQPVSIFRGLKARSSKTEPSAFWSSSLSKLRQFPNERSQWTSSDLDKVLKDCDTHLSINPITESSPPEALLFVLDIMDLCTKNGMNQKGWELASRYVVFSDKLDSEDKKRFDACLGNLMEMTTGTSPKKLYKALRVCKSYVDNKMYDEAQVDLLKYASYVPILSPKMKIVYYLLLMESSCLGSYSYSNLKHSVEILRNYSNVPGVNKSDYSRRLSERLCILQLYLQNLEQKDINDKLRQHISEVRSQLTQ